MGASNVIAAYALYAGKVPATSMQLLAYMAAVSKDDDRRPWFGQGHLALAEHALGRPAPISRPDVKAVERAVAPLLAVGAIKTDRKASVRREGPHTVRYRLCLNAADVPRNSGDVEGSQDSQRPPENGHHVPRKTGSRPPENGLTSPGKRGTEEPRGTTRSEKTEEEVVDLPADLTLSRARGDGEEDRIPSLLPKKCPHGFKLSYRPDGQISCVFCRRETSSDPPPDGDPDRLAPVISLPLRSA